MTCTSRIKDEDDFWMGGGERRGRKGGRRIKINNKMHWDMSFGSIYFHRWMIKMKTKRRDNQFLTDTTQ